MKNRSTFILHRLIIVILFLAGLPSWALDSTKPPGSNFDLTHWYLGLPVDSSGGTNGASASISAAQLVAGYSNAFWFYTGTDGAMTFWAPVTGATTSGSSYPRSELREQISPPSNSSNWTAYGSHLLDCQCKVTQVPSTGKVIIGQIHGYTGAALPLVKVQYENGTITALIKTNSTNDSSDLKYAYANVGLSNTINYQIKVVNGLVSVTVNGTTQSLNVFQTDPNWATNTLYYKAGDYCQDNVGTTNEGARVAFYAVSASHAPAITNQPVSVITNAGNNVTFSVSATGNGPLGYQWFFNTNNSLVKATNASLTLTNVQTTNAGSYSVVVHDGLGSVTSSVATLDVRVAPTITNQPVSQTVVVGQSATFTVSATGSVPLGYQWYFNTNTMLAGGTNAMLILTNVQTGAAGVYFVVVSNSVSSLASSNALLFVNQPPVPGNYAVATGENTPVSVATQNLLALAFDPDGDGLSFTSVNPLSTNGGTVALTNSLARYTPQTNYVGPDQMNYTLTDARGASAVGSVAIMVVSSNAIFLHTTGQLVLSNGAFRISYEGVPNLSYTVDRATNIAGPWEIGYTNLTADATGSFELDDLNLPLQPTRFYRARYP